MKVPKNVKRYCPYCKTHNDHKVSEARKKTVGTAHPQSYGSKIRARKRGRMHSGNKGRYSKPPISRWRMAGRKQTKKTDFRYECMKCKKSHVQKWGFRSKRIEFV